jgi:hypothetical protein
MCRRCGAPLHREGEDARLTLPAGLNRRRTIAAVATRPPGAPARPSTETSNPTTSATAAAAAAVVAFPSPTPDTLLPGAMPRPDNLLPRATRSRPAPVAAAHPPAGARARFSAVARAGAVAREHWRRVVVLVIVAVALVMSLVAVRPVVFGADAAPTASSAAQQARATSLLRTVVGGGRTLFAPKHSFARVSASALSAHSYKVPVVSSDRIARAGQVSMRVTSAAVLTLATPADARRCVFARDEPRASKTQFAIVPTAECRAAAAPAKGWSPR